MTDEPQAVTAELPATEGTVESAAQLIKTKREDIQTDQEIPQEIKPDDVEIEIPDGEAIDVEAGTEGPDAGKTPTIPAPAGWTPEEKEWFGTLEPARQESILRQYKSVQASEARRQNEYQEELRAARAEADAAKQERQQLGFALQNYVNPLMQEFQGRFADVLQGRIDPIQLSRQDPARFAEFQAYQERFRQIETTQRAIAERERYEQEQEVGTFRQRENARLQELIPELKDPEKFNRYDVEVSQFLTGLGIPPERVVQASADELSLAYDAMRWRRAVAAKKAQVNRPPAPVREPGQPPPPQAPRVLKPSSGNASSGQSEQLAAATKTARRTGDVEDVAAMIRAKRMAASR